MPKIRERRPAGGNAPPRYYSVVDDTAADSTTIYIYGDIVTPGWEWYDSDVSGYSLAQDIATVKSGTIHVRINSYGGHVSEGLAIHNQLKQHPAKIITYCDGFACSVASVVFMAGDERIMAPASLLMIHNAWTWAAGDANALRKEADDLEIITQQSVNAYQAAVNIDEAALKAMMDEEKWITPEQALEMKFATSIAQDAANEQTASQSVRAMVFQKLSGKKRGDPGKDITLSIGLEGAGEVLRQLEMMQTKMASIEASIQNAAAAPSRKFFNFEKGETT